MKKIQKKLNITLVNMVEHITGMKVYYDEKNNTIKFGKGKSYKLTKEKRNELIELISL